MGKRRSGVRDLYARCPFLLPLGFGMATNVNRSPTRLSFFFYLFYFGYCAEASCQNLSGYTPFPFTSERSDVRILRSQSSSNKNASSQCSSSLRVCWHRRKETCIKKTQDCGSFTLPDWFSRRCSKYRKIYEGHDNAEGAIICLVAREVIIGPAYWPSGRQVVIVDKLNYFVLDLRIQQHKHLTVAGVLNIPGEVWDKTLPGQRERESAVLQ